jgi:hypothetical protein
MIRRLEVQNQPEANSLGYPISKKLFIKKGLVKWLKH